MDRPPALLRSRAALRARLFGATLGAVLVVSCVASCASGVPEVPAGPDGVRDPVLVLGRDIYSSRCAGCHGRTGDGDQGPKLSDGMVVDRYPDIADQIARIGEGPEQMPAFADILTPEEIEAVARYTRTVL